MHTHADLSGLVHTSQPTFRWPARSVKWSDFLMCCFRVTEVAACLTSICPEISSSCTYPVVQFRARLGVHQISACDFTGRVLLRLVGSVFDNSAGGLSSALTSL